MASEKLGARLFQAREEAGFTFRELAARAGVSAATVNDIEKGHRRPVVDTLERLANALGISPCWLAYGIGTQSGEADAPPRKRG